jgi:hypothetical protein
MAPCFGSWASVWWRVSEVVRATQVDTTEIVIQRLGQYLQCESHISSLLLLNLELSLSLFINGNRNTQQCCHNREEMWMFTRSSPG